MQHLEVDRHGQLWSVGGLCFVLHDVLDGREGLIADLQPHLRNEFKAEPEQRLSSPRDVADARCAFRDPLVRVGVVDLLLLQLDGEQPDVAILLLLVHHEYDSARRIVLHELGVRLLDRQLRNLREGLLRRLLNGLAASSGASTRPVLQVQRPEVVLDLHDVQLPERLLLRGLALLARAARLLALGLDEQEVSVQASLGVCCLPLAALPGLLLAVPGSASSWPRS